MKFNLGDSDDEVDFLTHKGKKLGELQDDFKDEVVDSDQDFYQDKKGCLNEEMVNAINFGGGEDKDPEDVKKTREERLQEIMEKSKAYEYVRREIKL